MRLVFTFLLPREIFLNIPGEKSEENARHEGVIDHANAGEGLGDQVKRVEQVDEAKEATDEGTRRPLAVAAGEKIAKHGRTGTDQAGAVGQFGAGAEGVHDSLTMLNPWLGNEEFG